MAKLRINGDSSGYVDLEAPNAASSSTLDLDQVPQKNAANTFSANTQVITAASNAEALHIKGRSSDDIGQIKFMGNDGLDSAGRLDARTTKFEMASYSELHLSANGPNNAHLKIDASGRVTTPNQPSFKAALNTNTNFTTNTNIIFNTTSGNGRYNTGGHYSTSTGRFTAPVSGAYHFDVGLLYGPSIPNGTNFDDAAFLHLNGTIAAYDERRGEYVDGTTGNSGYYGAWIHTQVYMNSGDYVSVVNYNRFAGLHGNDRFTWFAGFLIG